MSEVDTRVVAMKFDNAQFEKGVHTTLGSLTSLNKGLKLEGATKGLEDVGAAANKLSLSHIGSAVDSIASKFGALSVAALTALTNIVNKAVDSGLRLGKSLTIEPILAGFREYETNLNSIQTILANTRWQNTGLSDVNAALEKLNAYSDQTIYNFSEMARNIGTFTAAGVKLDVATSAIKGIANLAAVSGSNAVQASTAMYQLSQAISAGKVTLEDWNSVVNAGMGGKVLQDALMETARVHGVSIDDMIKKAGSFRKTLEDGWVTGEILTETLSKFTGDLTEAQLKTMGYNDKQIAGILDMGKTAQEAATKVKTMTQLISTLQEAAGSGWAKTWQLIFGDFEEARTLFTDVNDVLGEFISTSADSRNKVVSDWKELGGRAVIIDAVSNAFHALVAVIKPIKDAFSQIFPATTGKQLYEMSVAIRDFAAGLKIGGETADNLRRTFAGVFAILGIGWEIVKQVAGVLLDLFGVTTKGSGGILEFTAKIGDFLVALHKAISEGEGLHKFFQGLGAVLALPIKLIQSLGKFIASLFDGFDASGAGKQVGKLVDAVSPMEKLGNIISSVWSKITTAFSSAWDMFEPLASRIASFFNDFSAGIASFTQGLGFNDLLSAINTGALVGLVALFKSFIGGGAGGGGILSQFGDAIDQVTDTLGAMQNTLRAATLLQIAIALGIIAVSVNTLAKVDAAGLTRSLTALSVMFGQLFAALLILEKMPLTSTAKLFAITIAMSLMAIAIRLLASSVKAMAELSWDELARGLTGVVVLLAAITAATNFMPNEAKLIGTSAAIVILALGIKILASAVNDLSGLSWEEMAKGLTGVGALLGALVLFTKFAEADKGGLLQGLGILLLAAGIKVLASAMKDIADMSWEEIGKGLTGIAGGLALLAGTLYLLPPTSLLSAAAVFVVAASLGMIADAMKEMGQLSWEEIGKGMTTLAGALTLIAAALILIPPTSALSAAGVLVVALALGMIGEAIKTMGGMSWEEIAKGMVVLAGSLTIITAALLFTQTALPGAAALLIVCVALNVLTGVLQTLAGMSWAEIGKGLLVLAAAFTVLGLAALILTPVIPAMMGLGIAIALIGAGLALAGAGVFLFATGLTALSVAGAAGTAAIVALLSAVIGLIPMIVQQVGIALVMLIDVLIVATPKIVELAILLLVKILQGLDKIMPQIFSTISKLLDGILKLLVDAVPKMVDAGLKILTGILNGIANNLGKVIDAAGRVIVAFIDGIGRNLGPIIDAGFRLIISFINGITNAINSHSAEMGEAGGRLAVAIVKGMVNGLGAGVGQIANAARNAARSALNAAMSVLGINSPSKEFYKIGKYSDEGFADGLDHYATLVENSAADVGVGALDSLKKSLSTLSDSVSGNIDLTPTITPVIDLTQVKKSAGELGTLFELKPVNVAATTSSANVAGVGYEANQDVAASNAAIDSSTSVSYTQYNNSPKALSAAEIYRQTRNQLSTAKGGLPK